MRVATYLGRCVGLQARDWEWFHGGLARERLRAASTRHGRVGFPRGVWQESQGLTQRLITRSESVEDHVG